MKKLFTLGVLLVAGAAFAQTENVGIGTTQPDKSAILDLSSSNKGFLLPRMSKSQRLSIVKPAQGLQVFQTDEKSGLYIFNGSDWTNAANSVAAATDPWLRGGNAIVPGEFIGTTNSEPLIFKSGNQISGYLGVFPNSNTFFGYRAGVTNVTPSSAGQGNVAIGSFSMEKNTSGSGNFAIGTFALRENTTGGSNFALGINALYNNNGDYNLGIGPNALLANTSGASNTGIGQNAIGSNTSGGNNTGVGQNSLYSNIAGRSNVALGNSAGFSSTGTGNVFLGFNAGYSETTNNKLYIANTNTTTPLIYGDFSAKFVTIGDIPASTAKRSDAVTSGGYNLLVKGGILTEKVKVALVTTTDWADYVFENEYKEKMMSLEDIEKYTLINKHLPNVPSAQEMVEKGMEVGQTSKMFMEKIEELTLYIIELNKRIKDLESKK